MVRYVTIAVSCFLFSIHSAFCQTFPLTVNAGNPLIFQKQTGMRSPLGPSAAIAMGDTVILAGGEQVTLGIETNSRLIFKGPGALSFAGDPTSAYISFNDGTAFLERLEPATFAVLTFWVRNYMFIPVGTAAALKVLGGTRTPAVAVLEGTVLMQSPTGESVEVAAGNFGCVERPGRLTLGTLGQRIVASLESWSGCKLTAGIPAAESSSLEMVDKEFIPAVENSPAAVLYSARTADAGAHAAKPESAIRPTASLADDRSSAVPDSPGTSTPAETEGSKSRAERGTQTTKSSAEERSAAAAQSSAIIGFPSFELVAGVATVGDEQWTRLAIGIDVPVWKFGIFFDIEAFIDQRGEFSKKGWDFRDNRIETAARKIRYIRFGRESDPFFVKIGGISGVTIGHGFVVDRFTNMLHYPDQKLLGLQLNVNDVTPLGVTLQVVGADAQELRSRDHGGVGAARLALKPLKMTGLPVVSDLVIGGIYAYDRNTYAPARYWKPTREEELIRVFRDHGLLSDSAITKALIEYGIDPGAVLSHLAKEEKAKGKIVPFGIYGGDLTLPIIATPFLSLDVYAQSGRRDDGVPGWGIGAPGVAVTVWRLSAQAEYRHVRGAFTPGFFGPYYCDERLVRNPDILSKAGSLHPDTLHGVFGRVGFDAAGVLLVGGAYQYMTAGIGSRESARDQRIELTGAIGPAVIGKIPKVKKLEAYFYKTRIGAEPVAYDSTGAAAIKDGKPTYDRFFEPTPFMYYGYRAGFEIAPGATLLWDWRYGYLRDSKGTLFSANSINVSTAFTF